jgi:multidrug transporter EmrE-like cation transporter
MIDQSRMSPGTMALILSLISALGYCGAQVAMKYTDRVGVVPAGAAITVMLAGAVYFETAALRLDRVGMVLLMILAFECIIGLLLSWLWFREGYSNREMLGIALMVAGLALTRG